MIPTQDTAQRTAQGKVIPSTSHDQCLINVTGFTMTMTFKNLRTGFMLNVPYNEFKFLEGGAINATLVDIIVLLPQWFRNPRLLPRFMNSGLTAAHHYAILEKHRDLDVHTEEDAERAHEHLSTAYRTNMRKTTASWTRRSHELPEDRDGSDMDISNYQPEPARNPRYKEPGSIKFTDLAIGVKQLPQGDDAGDLTRALDFAMKNMKTVDGRKSHYVFPDDIHIILDQIGRILYTEANFDYAVIIRHEDALNAAKVRRINSQATRAVKQTIGSTHFEQQLPQYAISGQSGLAQSLGSLSRYTGFGQPVPMPSYQQRLHQAPFGQQSSAPLPYEPTPGTPLSHVSNTYQSTSAFKPIAPNPYQSTSYIGTNIQRPEQHAHNVFPFNAQQAVASLASNPAASAFSQPTRYLHDFRGLSKYIGKERVEPLQLLRHCAEEQQMDCLMAANQTREPGSPLLWLDPLSEQDGHGKQQSATSPVGSPAPYPASPSHGEYPHFNQDENAME